MRAAAVVCERECRGMLETLYAARGSSARERLGLLDRVSQRLCETVDRAELLRCVHPAEETRREADAVFEVLSHLIATLNTSEQLHAACVAICSDGATSFGEEERRVADTYRSELEAHGVHLGPSVRQDVVELQGEEAERARVC
jgi:intermediate peptidase